MCGISYYFRAYTFVNAKIKFLYSLIQVHPALRFDHKLWLKCYIHFNITQRDNASNEFQIIFFKPMNNAEFGKAMENLRNHRNIKLANCQRNLMRLVAQSSFKIFTTFHEDLIAIEKASS